MIVQSKSFGVCSQDVQKHKSWENCLPTLSSTGLRETHLLGEHRKTFAELQTMAVNLSYLCYLSPETSKPKEESTFRHRLHSGGMEEYVSGYPIGHLLVHVQSVSSFDNR